MGTMSGVKFLQRRRARFLIRRGQPFADEELMAVAIFTWVGNSMGAQPGVRGRAEWAGGLPDWTLIGAGASRLFVIEAYHVRPDKGKQLVGSPPASGWAPSLRGECPQALTQVRLTEESYDRNAGPIPLGSWRAIRFEFGDREPAVLQPFGREVDALLEAHGAAQSITAADGVRWDALAEVVLMTTSRGPFEEDVFFVLTFDDGSDRLIPLGEGQELLTRLQDLPGFDNETFIRAMAVSEEGVSVLWRR